MPWPPAITDIEQLKDRPEVALLLASETIAVEGVKFDRDELTIWVERTGLRDACRALKDSQETELQLADGCDLRRLVSQQPAL